MAVTAVMLGMYLTGIIVTDRFRKIVFQPHLVDVVLSRQGSRSFGGNVHSSSPSLMSIGFSVLAALRR